MITTYESLKLTNNSKVRFFDGHYNTFSLTQGLPEHGGSCPGATAGTGGCVSCCYDANLRKLYKGYANVADKNFELLKGKTQQEMFEILDNTIKKWLLTTGAAHPFFRISTGGDLFSLEYTHAWRMCIEENPTVHFWCYTRSLFAAPILAGIKNLTLLLSCDPVNRNEVFEVYEHLKHHPNLSVAWMGNELPAAMPKNKAVLVCPAVTGKTKKRGDKGACAICRACIDRPLKSGEIRHIQFPIHR